MMGVWSWCGGVGVVSTSPGAILDYFGRAIEVGYRCMDDA